MYICTRFARSIYSLLFAEICHPEIVALALDPKTHLSRARQRSSVIKSLQVCAHEIARAPCDSRRIHVRSRRPSREEHIAEGRSSRRSRTRSNCGRGILIDRVRTGFWLPLAQSVFQISLPPSMRLPPESRPFIMVVQGIAHVVTRLERL